MPVFGLVYDPQDAVLRWGDLTGYLRLNPHQAGGTIPISRDTILDCESLRGAFRRAAAQYADARVALGLLADSDDIQEDAVFDAWALGRKDVRYLILLRRLILELRPRSVRKAIVALSHATPHPDIFWTDRNWIPAETKLRAVASFRWSPLELAHMLKVLGADDWGRGQLAQSVDMLVREDPSAATTLDQSIGLLLADREEEAASGAALLVLASSEDPRATLSDLTRRHCELVSNSWFKEIANTIEVWGAVSLYRSGGRQRDARAHVRRTSGCSSSGRSKLHPALKNVADHMRELGLGALTHALRLSLYADPNNESWGDLSVLNGAHAAEILIKARIAVEHPLLIFSQIPRSTQAGGPLLAFEDLFQKGQTIDFQDLPERLWAVTGQSLPNLDVYREFGRLRNALQHFASPQSDPRSRTLEFVFKVLDPFIFKNWGLYAIDYNEEFGDHYDHIFESLVTRDIRPLISPAAAAVWKSPHFRPDQTPQLVTRSGSQKPSRRR